MSIYFFSIKRSTIFFRFVLQSKASNCYLKEEKKDDKKMHAAVFYAPGDIRVNRKICSDIGENNHEQRNITKKEERIRGVLVRVKACAVCGYDVRVYRNGHPKVTPPIILGHEICGQIDTDVCVTTTTPLDHIGEGIEREEGYTHTIKSGSRVAVCPIIPCLNCIYCHYEQYNLCVNLKEIGSSVNGGFAEFVRIPKEVIKIGGLVPIPDNISDEEASLLEPLACCLNGVSHLGEIVRKDKQNTVAIIGDGPVGLLHLQLLQRLNVAKTMVIGRMPQRIQKAKSMGADATVLFSNDDDINDTMQDALDFTDGIGFNVIIVTTSNPSALHLALKIAGKNSKINIFAGMPKWTDKALLLDPNLLHYNQISITGSFSSTPSLLQQATKLVANKEIDLSKIISHRYCLQNINEAMVATEKYYGLRVVINKF
jgi:L-iditol 2-dehydrogenase